MQEYGVAQLVVLKRWKKLHSGTLDNAIFAHSLCIQYSQNVGNFEKHDYINICTCNVEATFQPSNWILAYCEVEERNYCYVWGLVKTMPKT